jgi:tRNA 2-thiocytidine biosynthesis protein TtcA
MCYSGEISTLRPAMELFHGRFTLIRPLAYVEEGLIERFAQRFRLPVSANPCPSAETSRRADIRRMLSELYRANRKVRGNLFRALHHVKPEYLLKQT